MRAAPLFLALILTACGTGGSGSSSSGSGGSSGSSSGGQTYQQLQTQLEQGRTQFLPTSEGATEIIGINNDLYWLEFPTYNPTLHRYDDKAGVRIDYGFSIGTGDAYNFEASPNLVVTAANDGCGNVVFSAYDATVTNSLIGTATVPAPADEEQWWTYSVDGTTVYFATTGNGPATLYSWVPSGGGMPTMAGNLGSSIAALNDLGVVGNVCGFIDLAGGVWMDDLTTGTVTSLGNAQQASGFSMDSTGILYTTGDVNEDAYFYSFTTKQTADLGAQLLNASYALSASNPSGQAYSTDAALHSGTMVYIGQTGLFQLDLTSGIVTTVLLDGTDGSESVEYRYPMPLDDGTVYVVGLESTCGSTGADGPVFKVALPSTSN